MQSPIDESIKLEALRMVQFAGVIFGLIAVILIRFITTIPKGQWYIMLVIICSVALATYSFFGCSKHSFAAVRQVMNPSGTASSSSGLSFSTIMRWCAFLDLGALAYLIYATGGSRESLFVPYLFIIVPVTIILEDSKLCISLYFVITVVIFWVCLLWWKCAAFAAARPDIWYNIAYGVITTLCVFFPTYLRWKAFARKNSPSLASATDQNQLVSAQRD